MGKYEIEGGKKLYGEVKTESAKNALLPIIAASVLTDEQVIIEDCPPLKDVLSMLKILEYLGVKSEFRDKNLIIDAGNIKSYSVPYTLTGELRTSVLMVGTLLSRFKKASVSCPGGCEIGARPIDIHLDALRDLGVTVSYDKNLIICSTGRIGGGNVFFNFPSVGATENIILASVMSNGRTVIHNAAREPEIEDLANFINKMGGKVKGAGTSTVVIDGVKKLYGINYKPISDRIEAGTYLIAAAITGGEIEVRNAEVKNILPLLTKLCDNTCKIRINNDIIYLKSGVCHSFDVKTGPYPMFPTDLQSQVMSLATVSDGVSNIEENVFEMRFNHIKELKNMGADITVYGKTATVKGVKRLHGAEVYAHDLRGGAALVLAGLSAEGQTVVKNIEHIKRGYFGFDEKLRMLGAKIRER